MSEDIRTARTILRGRAVLPADAGRAWLVEDALVAVAGDRLTWAGPAADAPAELRDGPDEHSGAALPEGAVLLPGLVDLHCHGAVGHDYATADDEGVRAAAAHHSAAGTTTRVASVVSLPPDALTGAVATLAPLAREGVLAGIHLEGPYLSRARCGAQDPQALRDPDARETRRLLEAAGGTVVLATLAPERPGATEVADLLRSHGATVAVGHTDADFRTALGALRPTGTRPAVVTHAFNCMGPLHHRDPGAVGAALTAAAHGEAVLELVADGTHLADETVTMLGTLLPPTALALVTDAMAATGNPDGSYRIGRLDVAVADGVARLTTTDGSPGAIAGGTSTLLDVVRRVVTRAGLSLADAVAAASATPARVLGLADEVGSLAAGRRADVLVVDADLAPLAVLERGTWVRSPRHPG